MRASGGAVPAPGVAEVERFFYEASGAPPGGSPGSLS
jgi:hypothetical protein